MSMQVSARRADATRPVGSHGPLDDTDDTPTQRSKPQLMNAQLPIIDATTLAYALDDLLDSAAPNRRQPTHREDLRDLRRILANLPADTVRMELDGACVRALKATRS